MATAGALTRTSIRQGGTSERRDRTLVRRVSSRTSALAWRLVQPIARRGTTTVSSSVIGHHLSSVGHGRVWSTQWESRHRQLSAVKPFIAAVELPLPQAVALELQKLTWAQWRPLSKVMIMLVLPPGDCTRPTPWAELVKPR